MDAPAVRTEPAVRADADAVQAAQDELRAAARRHPAIVMLRQIQSAADAALQSGEAGIWLVTTRQHAPHGESVRLLATEGPLGTVLHAMPDNERRGHWKIVAKYSAARVAEFCRRRAADLLTEVLRSR